MSIRTITITRNNIEESHTMRSVVQTYALAKRLLKDIHGGDVLALSGELGAGKTTFAQGIAEALGIAEPITSPTFVLLKVYKLKKAVNGIARICHIDAYRLKSSDELAAIGAGEYIGDAQTLTVIEWPERVSGLIPRNVCRIFFTHVAA